MSMLSQISLVSLTLSSLTTWGNEAEGKPAREDLVGQYHVHSLWHKRLDHILHRAFPNISAPRNLLSY